MKKQLEKLKSELGDLTKAVNFSKIALEKSCEIILELCAKDSQWDATFVLIPFFNREKKVYTEASKEWNEKVIEFRKNNLPKKNKDFKFFELYNAYQ